MIKTFCGYFLKLIVITSAELTAGLAFAGLVIFPFLLLGYDQSNCAAAASVLLFVGSFLHKWRIGSLSYLEKRTKHYQTVFANGIISAGELEYYKASLKARHSNLHFASAFTRTDEKPIETFKSGDLHLLILSSKNARIRRVESNGDGVSFSDSFRIDDIDDLRKHIENFESYHQKTR